MSQFKIHIMKDSEFDSLGNDITRGSDISDSLGFADPRTGNAYVRYTSYPELNKFLVNHELEELTTDKHHHEDENGIRHKKFWKDFLGPALTFGIMKPEAPKRAAAQTFSEPQQQAPTAFDERAGGILGQFQPQAGGTSTSQGPNVSGQLNTGLTQGLSVAQQALNKIRQQQYAGDFAGRIRF